MYSEPNLQKVNNFVQGYPVIYILKMFAIYISCISNVLIIIMNKIGLFPSSRLTNYMQF